jgi:hypothetical protein
MFAHRLATFITETNPQDIPPNVSSLVLPAVRARFHV